MALFNLFGSRKKNEQRAQETENKDEFVTVQVKKSELDAFNTMMALSKIFEDSPEAERRVREIEEENARIEREVDEQFIRRREALERQGVPVDSITIEKCRKDLFKTVSALCHIDFEDFGPCEREIIAWQTLTKTGKVPKCVAHYCVIWPTWDDKYKVGPVSCEVGYLADGTPYTAWVSDHRLTKTYYSIKIVDGELALVAENPA